MADIAAIANVSKNLRSIADGDLRDEDGTMSMVMVLTDHGVGPIPLDVLFRCAADALDVALAAIP